MTDERSDDLSRLRIERLILAPVEEVFAAWTMPEVMALWLSPVGHAEVESNLSVAGGFRVLMVGEDMRIEHTGEYLEIDPPHRLSFTWNSRYTGSEPSVVTVDLVPVGDQTRLVLIHERLPKDQVDSHAGGWTKMIDRLAELLLTDAPASEESPS